MKPAPFVYAKARTVKEAVALIGKHRGDARLLAGGQSLIASLNMRLSAPDLLVDINGIKGLDGIARKGKFVEIGALARHAAVERSKLIAQCAPLIALAMPHIGHAAIRNRGTFGGSIAFADPAAELPACLVAMGGEIEIAGSRGKRRVKADAFFKGLFETALKPREMLTAVRVPAADKATRVGFAELARRHGDYAMVGLAASGARHCQRADRRPAGLFRRRRQTAAGAAGGSSPRARRYRGRGGRARARPAGRRAGNRRGEEASRRRAAAAGGQAADGGAVMISESSCAGLTRASIMFRKKMDCRVKPGNDRVVSRS